MRKIILSLFALCALGLSAQVVPTPNPIPVGYTGQITLTFDPTKGNGGMKTATACYAHIGYCTATKEWQGVIGTWGTTTQPQLTATEDGKWQLVIDNMFTFFGVPETTPITALVMVFHNGKKTGTLEGKATGGRDIYVTLGEVIGGDIWDDVEGVTAVTRTRPSGISQGIYYDANDPTKVTLCTYAASKTQAANRVFLLGDMTNWRLDAAHQLYKDGNYFWITLTGLTPGQEYRFQYAVERADGVKVQISDLYSTKVIHPDDKWEPKTVDPTLISYPTQGADGGYVTVIQPGKPAFQWSDATLHFVRPNKNNLVIYEVWTYDYTLQRSIPALMDRLDYIQNLGVNAIELMPICEFDGNYNWGYSPNHYFAPDRAYGSETMYKQFIDECHKRGIAVILDMVFNHATGLNPMNKLYPYGTDLSKNPWFNVTAPHEDNVYEDWNHDFTPAQEMFKRAIQFWLTEYKVDGFRFDLSHGFCGTTKNSVTHLKDYYNNGLKAVSPTAYMICEHWGSQMGSERPQLISEGMLCWNNTNNAYMQAAMGWLKEGDAFGEANQDGYVSYCESHDEERMQYKAKKYGNGTIKTDEATRLNRVPACVAFNVLLNGSHMLWQFEEIGYDYSINSDIDHPNGESDSYRCNKKVNPASKGYFTQAERVAAFKKCAQVIALRTQLMPSVFEGNPTSVNVGTGVQVRTIQWGSNVFAAANFGISNSIVDLPSGTWFDYLNGATRATASTYTLAPGELKVFTGSAVNAPVINDIEHRDHTAVELIGFDEAPRSRKILLDGQIYILHGDKIYDLNGRLVR